MILSDVTKMTVYELASELRSTLVTGEDKGIIGTKFLTREERIRILDLILELEHRGMKEDEKKLKEK